MLLAEATKAKATNMPEAISLIVWNGTTAIAKIPLIL
jgi:hypothetical protein